MMILESHDNLCDQSAVPVSCELAIEARFILSAMEAAETPEVERRRATRVRYRVEATLRLASGQPYDSPRLVYTRDLTAQGLGLISPVPLPLGSAATLLLPAPDGDADIIACHIIRCREMLLGWFDCAVVFKEETTKVLQNANAQ